MRHDRRDWMKVAEVNGDGEMTGYHYVNKVTGQILHRLRAPNKQRHSKPNEIASAIISH